MEQHMLKQYTLGLSPGDKSCEGVKFYSTEVILEDVWKLNNFKIFCNKFF